MSFGTDVGANVVLTANTQQYQQQMQQAGQSTNHLAETVHGLQRTIDGAFHTAGKISLGLSAADVGALTAATAMAARFQDQMRGLQSQSNVLNQQFGNGRARMDQYTKSVDSLRMGFGAATSSAATLVQTISGFERSGSTQGLQQLANTFMNMAKVTGENSAALAQSVLGLGQTMGTTMAQVKGYSDQLVTMADASNTTAESLANFASQIGPLGRTLNMTQSEVVGFAAAFSKAGQDGYRASNVFNQLVSGLGQSLQSNAPALQQYANLLGVTVGHLRSMSGSQVVAGAMDSIYRAGPAAIQALNRVGIDGVQAQKTISAVVQQNGGSIQSVINQANGAYGNGATGKGADTLTDQFKKIGAALAMAGESFGKPFLAAMQKVMPVITAVVDGFTKLAQSPIGKVAGILLGLGAPILAAVGGLLLFAKTMTILAGASAAFRSSLGSGLVEGVRGFDKPGGIATDMGLGRRGKFVANATNAQRARNPFVAPFYQGGYAAGSTMRSLFSGRGPSSQYGRRGTAWVADNLINPQWDANLYSNPYKRTGFAGPFVSAWNGVKGKLGGGGSMEEAVGGGAGETASATTRFKLAFTEATQSLGTFTQGLFSSNRETAAGARAAGEAFRASGGDVAKASSLLSTELGDNAAVLKLANEQLQHLAATTEKLTVAESAATGVTEVEARTRAAASIGSTIAGMGMTAGRGMLAGTMQAARGIGGAAMGLLGGPVGLGLTALTLGPTLLGALGLHQGSSSPPESAAPGTGAAFTINTPPTVAANTGSQFNAANPTGYTAFQATQKADFNNAFMANVHTPGQAAAQFGPYWNTMSASDREAAQNDVLKAFGGNQQQYQQFYAAMMAQTAQPSGGVLGSNAYGAVSGMTGGVGNLLAEQQKYNAGLYNTPGAQGALQLQNIQAAFRGAGTYQYNQHTLGMDDGGAHTSSTLLQHNNASTLRSVTGFLGSGDNFTASSSGHAVAQQLGLSDQDFTMLASKSGGTKGAIDFKKFLQNAASDSLPVLGNIKGLGNARLTAMLTQLGLPVDQNNPDANLKTLQDALVARPAQAKQLYAGMKISGKEQGDISASESTNPDYYGQKLSKQLTGKQLFSLLPSGQNTATLQSALGFQATQAQINAPFMNPLTQIFGSSGPMTGQFAGGITSNPSSLQAQMQGWQSVVNKDRAQGITPDQNTTGALTAATNAYSQAIVGAVQQIHSFQASLHSLGFSEAQFKQSQGWQAQAEALSVGREKTDYGVSVGRADYEFALQRKRSEYDFGLQRKRAESDFNLQRSRAQSDHDHAMSQMIKSAAMSMMDIYKQNQVQGLTSVSYLLYNNRQQTAQMGRQESQLGSLRNRGLSSDAIQQLGLTDANNNQELNSIFQEIARNPQYITQLNQAVQQRIGAAGALATDASSQTFQEQQYQFNLSLKRSETDFHTSMSRSQTDFNTSANRTMEDFHRTMGQQAADFGKQLGRQQADYLTSTSHAWTQFTQGVAEQMYQLDQSLTPLADKATILKMAMNSGDKALAAFAQGMYDKLYGPKGSLTKTTDAVINLTKGLTPLGAWISGLSKVTPPKNTGNGIPTLGAGGGGGSYDLNFQPTSGMCLADVEHAFGAWGNEPTALAAWYAMAGHRHMGSAPAGVPVFFGAPHGRLQDGSIAGHVAISAGGGMMWSEDADNRWELKPVWNNGYLGWTDALNGVQMIPGMHGFAKGSWEMPQDQIAQVHKGEMILPAQLAEAVRAAIGGGYGVSSGALKNLHTTSAPCTSITQNHTHHTDASTHFTGDVTVVAQDPSEMANQLKQRARVVAMARR